MILRGSQVSCSRGVKHKKAQTFQHENYCKHIDRFKKFARLGTSHLISDAESHQFLQPCEAKAHMTTLQNQYTVLKMQSWIMQTQQLLGFSRFPSQHLEES